MTPTDIRGAPAAEQALANLVETVEIQSHTIAKLIETVRTLSNRVEQLERDRPTRPIA